ncbi:MAG: helix-turn-helix domain-containing protein, partial [Bacteroidota bacterium]
LELEKGDYCFIPGLEQSSINTVLFNKLEQVGFMDWLNAQHIKGVTICSVCNGAFILAKAGLLNGRRCTTHWKSTQQLAKQFPKARVQEDCIYTEDRGVFTSAGVAAGIDLSLAILEKNHGALFAAKVGHELVVYMRRNGLETQKSVYLEYRNHVHNGVHRVQDWLVEHLDQKTTIEQLATLANMSARNLTRIFRKVTGISINEFQKLLRIEKAQQLLQQTNLTIEHIAQQCGFENPRQFRRIWKAEIGSLPSAFRKENISTNA